MQKNTKKAADGGDVAVNKPPSVPKTIKARGKAKEQPETVKLTAVFYRNKGNYRWRSFGGDLFESDQQAVSAVTGEMVEEIALVEITLPNPLHD